MNINRRRLLRSTAIGAAAAVASPFVIRDLHADDAIKVAGIHDTSGGLDIYGKQMVATMDLAVNEINAAGGVLGRKLQLINYDPQSNIQLYTQYATEAATKEKVAVCPWRHHLCLARGDPPAFEALQHALFLQHALRRRRLRPQHLLHRLDAGADGREAGALRAEEVGQEDLHHRRRLQLRPDHRQMGQEVRPGQWRRGRGRPTSSRSTSPTSARPSRRSRRPSPTW